LNLQRRTSFGDPTGLGAQLARFGAEARERAVRIRDRAFGIAQRIARLAGGGLLLFKLAGDGVDAPAQRFQIFFLSCAPRRPGDQPEQQKNNAFQTFAFPCAATEATRRATSAGSPR
jgi:hypothetical protein